MSYEIKLADGRKLYPTQLEYNEKGIRFPIKDNKGRFIPYEAILWVDYDL